MDVTHSFDLWSSFQQAWQHCPGPQSVWRSWNFRGATLFLSGKIKAGISKWNTHFQVKLVVFWHNLLPTLWNQITQNKKTKKPENQKNNTTVRTMTVIYELRNDQTSLVLYHPSHKSTICRIWCGMLLWTITPSMQRHFIVDSIENVLCNFQWLISYGTLRF